MVVIMGLLQEQRPEDLHPAVRSELVHSLDALVEMLLESAWRDATEDESEGAYTMHNLVARHFKEGTPPATPTAPSD